MKTKVIHYVRHGESLANEAIRNALAAAGLTDAKNQFAGEAKKVSYEVMNSSANFDAGLSTAGIQQAKALAASSGPAATRTGRAISSSGGQRPSNVELIVASSLTRAIHTAALVFPAAEGFPRPIVCLDETREFAGPPTSEKRHPASEMHSHLARVAELAAEEVDISRVEEVDALWSPAEESGKSAFGRADKALAFLMARPERNIAVVGHTSFMRQCLLGRRSKNVVVVDGVDAAAKEALWSSFENCEVRSVEMWVDEVAYPGKYFIRPLLLAVDAVGALSSKL